ncbi:CD225/dispanin family protein [Halosquirtibacter laminarini]|uniref:CD225/dispanin family protein n=1 Tax=Halosquirtibacter laminarini TaxID=3374600 RepID=A0AC61NHQ9_9BACT|nr:CD225/dispanin family protein [Prolixibacteraceae bacterium]
MNTYFIIIDGEKVGPIAYDQLIASGLSHDTLVHHSELDDWTLARELPELQELLQELPPQMPKEAKSDETQKREVPRKPKTFLVESILVTICCCQPLAIVAIVYASSIESLYNRGDYEKANKYSKLAKTIIIVGMLISLLYIIYNVTSNYDEFVAAYKQGFEEATKAR